MIALATHSDLCSIGLNVPRKYRLWCWASLFLCSFLLRQYLQSKMKQGVFKKKSYYCFAPLSFFFLSFHSHSNYFFFFKDNLYQNTEQRQSAHKPISFLLSSPTMTSVWTSPTPEPIRQRVVRWAAVCFFSAFALFANNCTSIWSNWLPWPCPGVLWKRNSELCPSAHFAAHRPWHHWLGSCFSKNWTPQSCLHSNPANIFDRAMGTKVDPAWAPKLHNMLCDCLSRTAGGSKCFRIVL